jgi:predicted DNA-binding ribbon-helix-helix protein
MEDIETIMQTINGCSTSIDLEKIVSDYLMAISEADNSHGETYIETYIETAQRLGGNKVLELANAKLLELDTGWHD